jgi:hypothetical protein
MKHRWYLAAILSLAAVLGVVVYVTGCVTPSGSSGGGSVFSGARQPVMEINGRKVYADELLKSVLVRNAIRQYANICTLKEEVAKKGIKLDPEKVKARIEEQKKQMIQMGQDWNQFLADQNVTEKDVEDQVTMYMMFEELVNSTVQVTDAQLKAVWERDKEQIITEYLTKNKLPDTEKAKITYEQCKDIVTDITKRENSGQRQQDITTELTQATNISLVSISDPTERKLYEDLIINNTKKKALEDAKKAAEAPAAPPAAGGQPGASQGGAPRPAPQGNGQAQPPKEGQQPPKDDKQPPKDQKPAPAPGK